MDFSRSIHFADITARFPLDREISHWIKKLAPVKVTVVAWRLDRSIDPKINTAGPVERTHVLIGIGLAVLIGSTVIVGYGNYLGAFATGH